MRRLTLGIALLGLAGCGASNAEDSSDCERAPDYAAWRKATTQRAFEAGQAEQTRRAVAAQIINCRTLEGASKRAVLRKLGRAGLPDSDIPAAERHIWSFYLGPDALHIDEESLHVVFDKDGRVADVQIGEG